VGTGAHAGAHAARRQPLFILGGGVTCGTTCDPCPPPPVSISTAQQCVYFFVFVEVERSVCGHRGACCTSTTMFLVGSCVFHSFCVGEPAGPLQQWHSCLLFVHDSSLGTWGSLRVSNY
jgi:hypothetical protein